MLRGIFNACCGIYLVVVKEGRFGGGISFLFRRDCSGVGPGPVLGNCFRAVSSHYS